jgi:hypothetical protein
MRAIRRFSQLVLTLVGGGLVIFAVYRVNGLYERVLLAALGLLVMELGIWQVTNAFFPNQREYRPLRKETDYFLKLVRRLNHAATNARTGSPTALQDLERVEAEMHHSVERMRRVAGYTEEELGMRVETIPAEPAMVSAGAFQKGRA